MSSIILKDRNGCPLCRSHDCTTYIPFPEIPVVQCRECGFIYSSRVLSEQDLASYYENDFGSQRHLQGQMVNARTNAWAIKKLLDIENIGNVLDVGTGYGFLLAELSKHSKLDAIGVELSRQEAAFARSNLGLNVVNLSLGTSGLEKSHFDLVTSFEVVEHASDPVEFIREMAQYVKPNGHLLLMTDNFDSRMAKFLGAGFPKWIPHSHISHFSATTLKKTIEATKGLTLIRSMSYTPWEVLLRAAYYKIRGIRKTPSEAFDLTSTLESEMKGEYKLFLLRKCINKIWAQLACSEKMDGDLIYFLAKKTA